MLTAFWAAVIGGAIGGILGVVGTLISSYYGPRKMEVWREKREEERIHGPRKRYLEEILGGDFAWYRLSTLARATGTTENECRRLLIVIGARGSLKKIEGDELWALEKRKPISKALKKHKPITKH